MSNNELTKEFSVPAEHVLFMIDNGLSVFSQHRESARLSDVTPNEVLLQEWQKKAGRVAPNEMIVIPEDPFNEIVRCSYALQIIEQLEQMRIPIWQRQALEPDPITPQYAPLVGLKIDLFGI